MWATSRSELTSYAPRTSSGSAQQPHEVGRHHHRRLGPVGLDGPQHAFGVEAPEDHHRDPRRQGADARQRAGVVHRPDHEVGAEQGERALRERRHVLGDRRPPANIVGGSSTPLGRPVVPDVYIRFGRGATPVDGSAADDPSSQSSHERTPATPSQRQPTTSGTPACSAAATPVAAVLGPTNSTLAPESERM